MDIYDFKNMGHSGFENCRIVDAESYSYAPDETINGGLLFEGDLDDAPECLDGLEVVSIDVYYHEPTKTLMATIDVTGVDEGLYMELGLTQEGDDGDFDGLPLDDSDPQLTTDPLEAGQWYE